MTKEDKRQATTGWSLMTTCAPENTGFGAPCGAQKKKALPKQGRSRKSSIPERIRTSNLRLRRPTLYPVELRGQHLQTIMGSDP